MSPLNPSDYDKPLADSFLHFRLSYHIYTPSQYLNALSYLSANGEYSIRISKEPAILRFEITSYIPEYFNFNSIQYSLTDSITYVETMHLNHLKSLLLNSSM